MGDELEEIGLTAKALADVIAVPPNRLYQILSCKPNVTADTALRLGQYFGMSSEFRMNLQSAYELDVARQSWGGYFADSAPGRVSNYIRAFYKLLPTWSSEAVSGWAEILAQTRSLRSAVWRAKSVICG